jgi:hypothetical protein
VSGNLGQMLEESLKCCGALGSFYVLFLTFLGNSHLS